MSTDDRAGVGHRRKALGERGERAAEKYLVRCGLEVLVRNYTCRAGEIDLVCAEAGTVVFVEVKLRRPPFDTLSAVDARKQRQISRTAFDFLMRHGMLDRPARFDVVGVRADTYECVHVRDAFDSTVEY